jgi:hypothetical protein
MNTEIVDRLAIRDAIESSFIWRDSAQWDRFASLWHPEGRMIATWFQAPAAEFIARSRKAWAAGMTALHATFGTSIDLAGDRAIAMTKTSIMQRAEVHGCLVDVICYGRFRDALEKRDGAWKFLLRQPIYELDHMIPVVPDRAPELDPVLLASFPDGYRNLAYLQTQLGFEVTKSMPGTRGPEIEALMERGRAWLAGETSEP